MSSKAIQPQSLIESADEIDSRMGPIPGRSSDRIARELRQAAVVIDEMRAAMAKTRSNLLQLSKSDDDIYAAMARRLDTEMQPA